MGALFGEPPSGQLYGGPCRTSPRAEGAKLAFQRTEAGGGSVSGLTVDSKKLEYGFRIIYAGVPSRFWF